MDIDVHRRRAETLRERYPFAGEVLGLYLALLDVWETHPGAAPEVVLPEVVKATEAAGPEVLAAACRELVADGFSEAWFDEGPVQRYLARAAARPSIDVGLSAAAPRDRFEVDRPASTSDDDVGLSTPKRSPETGVDRPTSMAGASAGARCPTCGGAPQLSIRNPGENLVTGARELLCAHCGQTWSFSASACPACGETTGAKRTVYAESHHGPIIDRDAGTDTTFPHLRIDACASCQRYLIEVDLGRDPRAVPEVDELAAMPLDLYAAEHGLHKITSNLMGF